MHPSQPPAAVGRAARSAANGQPSNIASQQNAANFGQLSACEQREAAAAVEIFRHPFRPGELAGAVHTAGSWLWHGYLGCGKLTLLTSQWKSGKTTLVSVLLARMAQGGEVAGLPVTAGRAAVVSEEGRHDWDCRCRKLGVGNHVGFYCRPFPGRPSRAEWLGMIEGLRQRAEHEGLDLVVIDPLSLFLPGNSERSAVDAFEALLPLRSLLALGIGVLLLHHPRKGRFESGQAARGSGVLASHADIVVEMSYVAAANDARYFFHSQTRTKPSRPAVTAFFIPGTAATPRKPSRTGAERKRHFPFSRSQS
jgi:AAA domain